MRFRRAGREADPLSPDLARALWLLILKTNPELRSRLEDWVSEDSLPEPMPTDVPWMEDVRLVGFLRRMVLEDGNARLSAGSGKGFW